MSHPVTCLARQSGRGAGPRALRARRPPSRRLRHVGRRRRQRPDRRVAPFAYNCEPPGLNDSSEARATALDCEEMRDD